MAKKTSSGKSGCLSSAIGVVAVGGVIGAVSSFFEEHKTEVIIICVAVIALLIIIAIMNSLKRIDDQDEDKARYKPNTLLPYYQLSDNEKGLMLRAFLFLKEGKDCFTPHDIGVAGELVSSNYYTTLFNKGYLDRRKRGSYSVNPVHLAKALDRYCGLIEEKIEVTNQVTKKNHMELAARSREAYMKDLSEVRLNKDESISADQLRQYIHECGEENLPE